MIREIKPIIYEHIEYIEKLLDESQGRMQS